MSTDWVATTAIVIAGLGLIGVGVWGAVMKRYRNDRDEQLREALRTGLANEYELAARARLGMPVFHPESMTAELSDEDEVFLAFLEGRECLDEVEDAAYREEQP